MATEHNGQHLLVVEDDWRLAQLTQEYLQQRGFQVDHEPRGDTAVKRILEEQPDLVILDLMLPGLDGIEVCKQIQSGYQGPVLMLTARDEEIDQIFGLEIGADDYITKPVHPRLLLARINALLRRAGNHQPASQEAKQRLNFGTLQINCASRQVELMKKEIELTTNEFELLCFLAARAGEVQSREQILKALRGIDYDGIDRWVDIRISRLRQKLGDDAHQPQRIKTVWNKGYLFVADAWNNHV
ncbi:DNA-binding response regulator [Motiliproteus sp. MSK22-1]|nr:DNA-binding response regulator [Motiliproteus sp. MSK22-1]